MKSSISEKGQVTIPKPIRDRLGLKAGTLIEFELHEGVIVARKAAGPDDPLEKVTGIVTMKESVDDYLRKSRGAVE
ncbi:MAG: AbrB/MazE/SpoVT family DNA-binding domain-containing protein [Deltaproteobacteria bacterium]|nr:MAG: AbrB/MazE/SpoVT family DNA-binding domain-containing protein [Deltaproteobacteria bacterium]